MQYIYTFLKGLSLPERDGAHQRKNCEGARSRLKGSYLCALTDLKKDCMCRRFTYFTSDINLCAQRSMLCRLHHISRKNLLCKTSQKSKQKWEIYLKFVYIFYIIVRENTKTHGRLWEICFTDAVTVCKCYCQRGNCLVMIQQGTALHHHISSLGRMLFTKGNTQPLIPQSDCSGRFFMSSLWKRRSSSYVST